MKKIKLKKIKLLSSLTLASAIVSGTTLAATGSTKMLGEYKANELRNAKSSSVVAFELSDPKDTVTSEEIKELGGYASVDTATKTEVSTGDIIKTNGKSEEKHVVVYGDVNGDKDVGLKDIMYASNMMSDVANEGQTEFNVEAADVQNDGKIALSDVMAISDFLSGNKSDYVTGVPEESKTPEVASKYPVTINGNNIVNNVNKATSKATVVVGDSDKDITIRLVLLDEQGNETVLGTNNFDLIPAHTTQQEISLKSFATGFSNKEYTLHVMATVGNGKEEDVGTSKFNVYIGNVDPTSANAITDRNGAYTANMSLDAYTVSGDVIATKVYYEKVDYSSPATNPVVLNNARDDKGITSSTKSIALSENRLDNKEIYNDLATTHAYSVYYVVEDSHGNRSKVYGPVTITTDGTITKAAEIAKVTLPDFSKIAYDDDTEDAKIKWELKDSVDARGKTYEVVLYRNGKPIAAEDIPVSSSADKKLKAFMDDCGLTEADIRVPGKYQVKIRTRGNENTTDSEIVASEEREVSRLNKVTDLKIEDKIVGTNTYKKVSWKSEYDWTKRTDSDVASYEVKLYQVAADGTLVASAAQTKTITNGINEVVFDGNSGGANSMNLLDPETIYRVLVTVKDGDRLSKVESEAEKTEPFFIINVNNISATASTDKTITLSVNNKITVAGETASYEVETWEVDKNAQTNLDRTPFINPRTVKVPLEEYKDSTGATKYRLVVKDLKPGTTYALRVKVTVGGVEGSTGYIWDHYSTGFCTTKKELPSLSNLKVVSIAEASNGIAVDGSNLIINGVTYTNLSDYGTELQAVYNLIHSGELLEGDVFTYTTEKLTVTLDNRTATRNFTNAKLELINNNKFIAIINAPSVKELTLKGKEFILGTVDTSAKVILDKDVKITTDSNDRKVTVVGGANVTINDVKINASKNVELTFMTDNKTVKVTPNGDVENALTFESNKNLDIEFTGAPGYTSKQKGTITVKASGGIVTIKGNGMSVDSELTVEASGNADVKIVSDTLAGAKNVKVTSNSSSITKVTVVPIASLPSNVRLENLELKDYGDDDLKALIEAGTFIKNANDTQIGQIRTFLNSFGLNGTGAKISTGDIATHTATGTTYTTYDIEFGAGVEVSNQAISGIK